MALNTLRIVESYVQGSPTTFRQGLDSDSGLDSDTESFSHTDKGELILKATQLNYSKNCYVSIDPLHVLDRSDATGGQIVRGFDKQIAHQMLQTHHQRVDPGYVFTNIHPNQKQYQIKVKTRESISPKVNIVQMNQMDVINNNNFDVKDGREMRSPCDEPINSTKLRFIELDETNKMSNSRCNKISHSSQNVSQLKYDDHNQDKPQIKSKSKMFSSQNSLVSNSKVSDVSVNPGLETKIIKNNYNTFGRQVSKNNNKLSTSKHRSEENLTKHQPQSVVTDTNDKPQNHSKSVTNKTPPLNIPHASIKNRNALNLRLFMSALSDMSTKGSPSTPTTPVSNKFSPTPSPGNCHPEKRKMPTKARSLDSTPQSSFQFNVSSLPMPEKSKKSSFSSLKKFFSLTFRSKSSHPKGDNSMKCRRKLFSDGDVIKEGVAFEMKEDTMKKRFARNVNNGKAWLGNTPESTPTIRSLRSQPTTPTRDIQSTVSQSDQDSAQDGMRIILTVFMKSSKNRIIKQLQQLDCIDVNNNGKEVTTEDCFQNLKKEFLNTCQKLFVSFRELSLNLFNSRAELIRTQTAYYKNSESYVQYLNEFLESSRNFVDATYASRVKHQFKALAKDVAKEGFNFLVSSHDCVVVDRDGLDEAYARIDELFNKFSNRFAKLIKWSRELQYCDTVSILW